MSKLLFPKLKRGIYTSPQTDNFKHERYVVENKADLEAYAECFPAIKVKPFNMYNNLLQSLKEGFIIILTDTTQSGFPSYCFENTINSEHFSSFNRVKLIEYVILSPDGFTIQDGVTYPNQKVAEENFNEWLKGYEKQGYYSSNNGRIPLNEMENHCKLIEI